LTRFRITAASSPAFSTICRNGSSIARAGCGYRRSDPRWTFQVQQRLLRAHQGDTAARHHASSTAARVACRASSRALLFLHLDFGGGTDLDDGDTAGELRNALLQLSLS